MAKYEAGDYVKVEFSTGKSGVERGWGWVLVESSDDKIEAVFGTVVAAGGKERILDTKGFFDFSLITEHKKGSHFD